MDLSCIVPNFQLFHMQLVESRTAMLTHDIDIGILPVRPSVRPSLSVKLRYCVETAERIFLSIVVTPPFYTVFQKKFTPRTFMITA